MSASCSSKIFAPSAKQIFRRGVDRLSCRNGTIAKMKYGDLAGVRIAVDDELVRGEEKTRNLRLEVILVRPEPWHFAIRSRLSHHCRRGVFGLIDGVLHVFEPSPHALAAEVTCTKGTIFPCYGRCRLPNLGAR